MSDIIPDHQAAILAAIRQTLTAAPPAGLGFRFCEERKLFEGLLQETKDGRITLPAAWSPPFGVIDPEPAETAAPNGRLYGSCILDIEGVKTKRTWRRTHDITWTPAVLICGKNRVDARAKRDVFIARLAPVLFDTVAGEDKDVHFAIQLDVPQTGIVQVPGLQVDYEFYDVRIRCRYGRYAYRDKQVKTISVGIPDEED